MAMHAQYSRPFLRGFGIYGAGTESAHHYRNLDQDKRTYDTVDYIVNPTYYYPRNHISHEYFGWGVGVFAELLPGDNIRWQTEFEYVKKGAKEKELINPFNGDRSSGFSANKYTYIQWNNYIKFYYPTGYLMHLYFLAGVRLEYLWSSSVSVYSKFAGSFPKIFFSGNLAAGHEFPITKKWYYFTEFHWNPDVLSHKFDNVRVRNRTLELRVGILYRPKQKAIDDCNAPRYKGPAY
jgi:hypothetical protein